MIKILRAAILFLIGSTIFPAGSAMAENTILAADAVNKLGVDLYKSLAKTGENLCISPYSIQSALAMTFAGAAGETREEMVKALHYGDGGDSLHASFAALDKSLEESAAQTVRDVEQEKKFGGDGEPIVLKTANRLFGKKGYDFRETHLSLIKKFYDAPLESINFSNMENARKRINNWIEEQTKERVKEMIAPGGIAADSRLVLVNALYLKAPWAKKFNAESTRALPFHLHSNKTAEVPTMFRHDNLGYAKRDGYQAVTIPYRGDDLHFLLIVPDLVDGLPELEKKFTAGQLAENRVLESVDVELYLPKFKIEPPTVELGEHLKRLGIKQAFDMPPGSANFDAIAPRLPDEYLYISQVLHKTFFALDEKGTEAAAATAIMMLAGSAYNPNPPKPVVVRADRPFLYAVQDRKSGTCLFLGKVADPR